MGLQSIGIVLNECQKGRASLAGTIALWYVNKSRSERVNVRVLKVKIKKSYRQSVYNPLA